MMNEETVDVVVDDVSARVVFSITVLEINVGFKLEAAVSVYGVV